MITHQRRRGRGRAEALTGLTLEQLARLSREEILARARERGLELTTEDLRALELDVARAGYNRRDLNARKAG